VKDLPAISSGDVLRYITAVGGGGKVVTVQSKGQQAAVLIFPTIGSFPGKPLHLNGAAMSTAFPCLLSPCALAS
jgi:hypothetical protein